MGTVIGYWLLVIGGAYGAVASRKSQVASIDKSTAKPCIPNLFPIPYSLFPKKSSTGGF